MPKLPSGTVTFLFTDIEGSTELLQRLGDTRYARVLADHYALLRDVFGRHGGQQISTQGDGLLVVFSRAGDGVSAAVAGQRAVLAHSWPEGMSLRVRMGLHTGEPLIMAGDYVGLDVHRAARICAAGHGNQILVSMTTGGLVEGSLPPDIGLRNLGLHVLRDLRQPEKIFQAVHPDLPGEFPTLRSLDVIPNNLPRQLTSFIGREREIAEVKRLMASTCMLMLTGSGGAGKTRLALQVAADLIETYADGVWLVELAGLSKPELVPNTVASVLNLREMPGRPLQTTLLDHIGRRELLLVLDNCEHLVGACAELATILLRSCPGLRILATSREPLGISGETVWRVPSLALPTASQAPTAEELMQCEATRLFIERATAVQPGFNLSPQNAGVVAAVCRRLDGIPLAIELAAARLRALSVEQIGDRLDERFRLLIGGGRTALPRQQTLRGALDWSYDLLPSQERVLLRRLSVFAGGWTLEAAEAACAGEGLETREILDLLTQLVFKSLVLMDAQEERVRYRLLETVRQYGRDRLDESGETAAALKRHLDWCLQLAERAEPELIGANQTVWLDRLEVEHDNLRAALEWSGVDESCGDAGLRLAGALWWFWHVHGYFSEGLVWLESMLSRSRDASASARAKALAGAGFLAHRHGDYDGSSRLCTESLALYRELGDVTAMGRPLHILGAIAEVQGDYARARSLFMESLVMGRQAGDKRRMAIALNAVGEVARCQDNYEAARASYEESLALSRHVGDKRHAAIVLANLGHVALHQGDHNAAAMLFKEALTQAQQLAYRLGIAEYLAGLGGVAAATGRHRRAARLLGAADALLSLLSAVLEPPDRLEYVQSLAAARAGLNDDAAFESAWAEGTAMEVSRAVDYALETDAPDHFTEEDPRTS